MKKIQFIITAFCLLFSIHNVSAQFIVDGICYNTPIEQNSTCYVTFKDLHGTFYSGDIIIPETVTYDGQTMTVTMIGTSAFFECVNLTSVSIPNTVTSIGDDAFYGCTNLKSVVIGNSVASIGWGTFAHCGNLVTIYCLNPVPPTVDKNNFELMFANADVYVPKGSLSAYKSADTWERFQNLHEIDPTGISDVETVTGPNVSTYGDNIVIENASGRVTVYSISGAVIANANADGGRVGIAVPGHGIYVIKADGKTIKVRM